MAGAILSGILLMVCIIWLTIVAGRKPEDTELYLTGFDKLPTEVGAIIVVGLWGDLRSDHAECSELSEQYCMVR